MPTDFAFIPFGGGARKCVGDQFALLEAQVVMVSLLQRFHFSAAKCDEVGMTTGATIHTVSGLFANVTRRTDAPNKPRRGSDAPAPREYVTMAKKTKTTVEERIAPEALV